MAEQPKSKLIWDAGRHRIACKLLARDLSVLSEEFDAMSIDELRDGLRMASLAADRIEDQAVEAAYELEQAKDTLFEQSFLPMTGYVWSGVHPNGQTYRVTLTPRHRYRVTSVERDDMRGTEDRRVEVFEYVGETSSGPVTMLIWNGPSGDDQRIPYPVYTPINSIQSIAPVDVSTPLAYSKRVERRRAGG